MEGEAVKRARNLIGEVLILNQIEAEPGLQALWMMFEAGSAISGRTYQEFKEMVSGLVEDAQLIFDAAREGGFVDRYREANE